MRWALLIFLVWATVRTYYRWHHKKTFSRFDNQLRLVTVTLAHLQFMIGLILYSVSPIVRYFYQFFPQTIHQRSIRFFGMEHSTMMIISVILISIGAGKAKRKIQDTEKFKAIAFWYTLALVLIFINIPWPFSPFASRPYLRM